MTLLFACRKCGLQAPDLSGHDCKPSAERLLAMLDEGRRPPEPKAVLSPPRPSPTVTSSPGGFDRNAYHKAYMKTYMRAWRARRKATSV